MSSRPAEHGRPSARIGRSDAPGRYGMLYWHMPGPGPASGRLATGVARIGSPNRPKEQGELWFTSAYGRKAHLPSGPVTLTEEGWLIGAVTALCGRGVLRLSPTVRRLPRCTSCVRIADSRKAA